MSSETKQQDTANGEAMNAQITNEDFLRAIAPDVFDSLWVCGNKNWAGDFATRKLQTLSASSAAYVAAGTIKTGAESRNNATFEAGWLIVLDDIGEKLDAGFAENFAPDPTYKIETSPGNEQWGYRIQPIETDPNRWNAFYELLRKTKWVQACDNSGLAAYKRLPVGRSNKGDDPKDAHKKNFETRLTHIDQHVTYTLDDLADALGIALTPENVAKYPATGMTRNDPLPAGEESDDTIFKLFDRLGMIKGGRGEDGWFECQCPWEDEHTTNVTSGTKLLPGQRFKCHHAHCVDRMPHDVENWLRNNPETKDEYEEWLNGFFDVVDGPEGVLPTDFKSLMLSEWLIKELPPREFLLGTIMSTTSRWILIGETGIGKTLFSLDLAAAIAAGADFLGWEGSGKRRRVMYLDGEMPIETFKERMVIVADTYDADIEIVGYNREVLQAHEMPPLNTPLGRKWLKEEIEKVKPDAIVLDSIMCLLLGDQKEEETWLPVKELVQWISSKRVAQIWLHHTGVDTSRGYGTKTKEWEMDSVAILAKTSDEEDNGSMTPFTLKWTKARLRTPHNFRDFEDKKVWRDEDGFKFEGKTGGAGARKGPNERTQKDGEVLINVIRSTYERMTAGSAPDSDGLRKVRVKAIQDDIRSRGFLQTDDRGALLGKSRTAFHKAKTTLILKGGYEETNGMFWEKVAREGAF